MSRRCLIVLLGALLGVVGCSEGGTTTVIQQGPAAKPTTLTGADLGRLKLAQARHERTLQRSTECPTYDCLASVGFQAADEAENVATVADSLAASVGGSCSRALSLLADTYRAVATNLRSIAHNVEDPVRDSTLGAEKQAVTDAVQDFCR
jgi:hypothetical protein